MTEAEDNATTFVRWYLRFNGYFTVDNFVVHAPDNAKKSKDGIIGEDTECDLLGIRLPYTREIAGNLCMANHAPLTDGADGKIDAVIAEVKTGKSNEPNPCWKHAKTHQEMVQYVVRFLGIVNDAEFKDACKQVSENYSYTSGAERIRYIIFCNDAADKTALRHANRGIKYIEYRDIIDYIIKTRGQSWRGVQVGVASKHQQWHPLINKIFAIANSDDGEDDEKIDQVTKLLKLT